MSSFQPNYVILLYSSPESPLPKSLCVRRYLPPCDDFTFFFLFPVILVLWTCRRRRRCCCCHGFVHIIEILCVSAEPEFSKPVCWGTRVPLLFGGACVVQVFTWPKVWVELRRLLFFISFLRAFAMLTCNTQFQRVVSSTRDSPNLT